MTASEAAAKKARGMTTDQFVANKIADNFKGYDDTDIDGKMAARIYSTNCSPLRNTARSNMVLTT